MNRLTRVEGLSTLIKDGWKKKDTEKNYTSICYGCEYIAKCVNKCGFCKALEKLAAYEDTGLEPEQIKSFVKDFGVSVVMKNTKLMNELKEYKDLEEQGLLIKLPCKVGDMVYDICWNYVESNKVKEIRFYIVCEYNSNGYGKLFESTDFGDEIFLTREEAEKALLNQKS